MTKLKWKLSLSIYICTVVGSGMILVDYLELRNVVFDQSNETAFIAAFERYKSHLKVYVDYPERLESDTIIQKFYQEAHTDIKDIHEIVPDNYLDSILSAIPDTEVAVVGEITETARLKIKDLQEAQVLFAEFKIKKNSYSTYRKMLVNMLLPIVIIGLLLEACKLWIDRPSRQKPRIKI